MKKALIFSMLMLLFGVNIILAQGPPNPPPRTGVPYFTEEVVEVYAYDFNETVLSYQLPINFNGCSTCASTGWSVSQTYNCTVSSGNPTGEVHSIAMGYPSGYTITDTLYCEDTQFCFGATFIAYLWVNNQIVDSMTINVYVNGVW